MERTRNSVLLQRSQLRCWLDRGLGEDQNNGAGHIRWGKAIIGSRRQARRVHCPPRRTRSRSPRPNPRGARLRRPRTRLRHLHRRDARPRDRRLQQGAAPARYGRRSASVRGRDPPYKTSFIADRIAPSDPMSLTDAIRRHEDSTRISRSNPWARFGFNASKRASRVIGSYARRPATAEETVSKPIGCSESGRALGRRCFR